MAAKKTNADEKITKLEAVRRSLEVLGQDASARDIQDDVKRRFGMDMTLGHAKTARRVVLQRQAAQAGTKTEQPATVQHAGGEAVTAPVPEKVSKTEAVRRSLAHLGKNASPTDIQKDVKERFGIDMTTKHISTTRGALRRQKSQKKPGPRQAALKPQEQAATSPPAQPAPTLAPVVPVNGKKTAVEIADLLTLRSLLDRVGADQLRTLIDVLAR